MKDSFKKQKLLISTESGKLFSDSEGNAISKAFFESLDNDAQELYTAWMSNPGNCSVKVTTYFQAYSDHLAKFRNKKCLLAEIGVMEGGSLLMWKKWLGNNASLVGIDMNSDSKNINLEGINIETGDQADPKFWATFFKRYPDVDIIVDDGGHQFFQQAITLFSVLKHITKNTIFI